MREAHGQTEFDRGTQIAIRNTQYAIRDTWFGFLFINLRCINALGAIFDSFARLHVAECR